MTVSRKTPPTLSVLVPTVPSRMDSAYPRVMGQLLGQSQDKPVEILALFDNYHRVIGDKRNDLMRAASGTWLTFVDDDDIVADDYIDVILDAIASNQQVDCITFDLQVHSDGQPNRRIECRVGQEECQVSGKLSRRSPNHIAVWRSELAKQFPFPSLNMGEDNVWYDSIVTHITSAARIDRVLYHYQHNTRISETQRKACRDAITRTAALSLLVPTVPNRIGTFWPSLMRSLLAQAENRNVEILSLFDNHMRTVGEKRNELLQMANGRYIAFIDDDDRVSPEYVATLQQAIDEGDNADVIVFDQLLLTVGCGLRCKVCRYGLEFEKYNDGTELWTGPPAHTQCWRAQLAKQCTFPAYNYTEDSAWVRQAIDKAESQVRITGPPLYYYDYNPRTSETRTKERRKVGRR